MNIILKKLFPMFYGGKKSWWRELFLQKITKRVQGARQRNAVRNNPLDYKSGGEFEKAWIKKWSVFGMKPTIEKYRVFREYVGDDVNIVPSDVARMYIEPILTPGLTGDFYQEKNSLGLLFDKSILVNTIIHSIDGVLYDSDYRPISFDEAYGIINHYDSVFIKKVLDHSGWGAQKFDRCGSIYKGKDGKILNFDVLNKDYGLNYIIQDSFNQSQWMAQFCESSVNTIRIGIYKDVRTGAPHFLTALMRIGKNGSIVDNVLSGGRFIGVEEDGTLADYVCDENGTKYHEFNGIDFKNNSFQIPNFDEAVQLACDISLRFPHIYLFSEDIVLDNNNKPKLLEMNTQKYSYFLSQYCGKPALGKYTDEIIAYCLARKKQIRYRTVRDFHEN